MRFAVLRPALAGCLLLTLSISSSTAQPRRSGNDPVAIPSSVLLQIIRAEDERRWDNTLPVFLLDKNPIVRKRATLAMGRIGNAEALPALLEVLKTDTDNDVRQMIAFALGEIESPDGVAALMDITDDTRAPAEVRARAVEALGKIGAALVNDALKEGTLEYKQLTKIRLAIMDALEFEASRRSAPDRLSILLGLTAALRTKADGAGPVIAGFLGYSNPRIVADALNTLVRLRLNDGNDEARELLIKHSDPIVRANAARVLGATEDKQAFDALLDRALHDNDLRVRVSAIRALGSLKDENAVIPLAKRGADLFKGLHLQTQNGQARNEGLEILNALGTILVGKKTDTTGPKIASLLQLSIRVRGMTNENILEEEIARARQAPAEYLEYIKGFQSAVENSSDDGWRKIFYGRASVAARAAGLAELGRMKPGPAETVLTEAQLRLREMLNDPRTPTLALSNILDAYAVFKPKDLAELERKYLRHPDVIVRATAGEIIGSLPTDETNTTQLVDALKAELPRVEKGEMNDAALAILEALAKQKSDEANRAIKTALDSSDYLIRRKAVALLKANGVGDFTDRIGTVKTRNTEADYRRAIARIGEHVTATVETSKGSFVIEFLSEDAPLTVDNFIQLAKKGFFNGQTIPRVVPNFVIQAGDPRGDTNGGPGYQIRCEINEVPYERGAVGMALSGKDTGGSQWFVTHSLQPHLDGGYTVFGHVIRGMEVVDNIARGDVIRRVIVNER